MLGQALSLGVYAGSAAVLTSTVFITVPGERRAARYGLLLGGLGFISLVAALEFPITRLPFWSRDFSLTWTLMVATLGAVGVVLLPRWIPSLGRLDEPAPAHELGGLSAQTDSPIGAVDAVGPRTQTSIRTWRHRSRLAAVSLGILAAGSLVTLYWRGAVDNLWQANTDPSRVDQSAYLNYARKILTSEYTHVGNRNRMPIYPWLLTFVIDSTTGDASFVRSKYFNLALSLAVVAVLALLVFHRLRPLEAAIVLLVSALMVFAFKAPYVQAEVLFYGLTATLFLLMLDYFRRPTIALAVGMGTLAGVAHLTKASVLPGLLVFLFVVAGSGIATALRSRTGPGAVRPSSRLLSDAIRVGATIAFFVLTVFPYIKNSWYRFGRPFYNVNSTFYIWYDSWAQVEEGTKAHGDRSGWPDMPAEEIPSLAKYLRDHSPSEIVGRLAKGVALTVGNATNSYGYAGYATALTIALAVAAVTHWKRLQEGLQRHSTAASFVLLYLGVQFLAFAWYADFVDGNRLVLALFIPLLVSEIATLRYLLGRPSSDRSRHRIGALELVYIVILAGLGADLLTGYTARLASMFGGS